MKIKIYISTTYIVKQRSDKCKKYENIKKRGIKNNKNIAGNLDVSFTITRFSADKASDEPTSRLPAATNGQDPVCLVLPFKDQAAADTLRTQLKDLSQKNHKTIQPVFVSQNINQHLKLREAKPPLVN